jgi:hypothetical protein
MRLEDQAERLTELRGCYLDGVRACDDDVSDLGCHTPRMADDSGGPPQAPACHARRRGLGHRQDTPRSATGRKAQETTRDATRRLPRSWQVPGRRRTVTSALLCRLSYSGGTGHSSSGRSGHLNPLYDQVRTPGPARRRRRHRRRPPPPARHRCSSPSRDTTRRRAGRSVATFRPDRHLDGTLDVPCLRPPSGSHDEFDPWRGSDPMTDPR